LGFLLILPWNALYADEVEKPTHPSAGTTQPRPLAAVLSDGKWKEVENSVDRALAWLFSQQAADGSFPTYHSGQPAVTSLCVLAFLARGHQPGLGPYGQQLNRAIDYVLSCQKPDGLLSYDAPGLMYEKYEASQTGLYNHAIAGLMLGEVYGHATGSRAKQVRKAISDALQFTRATQTRPKAKPADKGGWRYLRLEGPRDIDSDLSVTAWNLMFLRSAKNAEFDVPQEYVDEAMAFVRRCWNGDRNGERNVFYYSTSPRQMWHDRGLAGAGILSLSMAGQHQTPMALAAGDWLLAHPFNRFGGPRIGHDRFFYAAYYCSQAAAQLGGRYWAGIFPPLVETMLSAQSSDGSWPVEPDSADEIFGNLYTTAMAVLALTPPYQLLPVYQR